MLVTDFGAVKALTRVTHFIPWDNNPEAYDEDSSAEMPQAGMGVIQLLCKVYNRPFIPYDYRFMHISMEPGSDMTRDQCSQLSNALLSGTIRSETDLIVLFKDMVEKGIIPFGDYVIYD